MDDKHFAEESKNGKSLSHNKQKKRDDEDNDVSGNEEKDQREAELE